MKKVYISGLSEKEQVDTTFLVSKKEMGKSKAGKAYLNLRLMDKTGELEARGWDNADALSKNFNKDDVAAVKGFVVSYQGKLQINVTSIEKAKDDGFSWTDYLPSSSRDPVEMTAELDEIVAGIVDPHIRALLESFFSDEDIKRRFALAPAAMKMHHPYLGGLLEHVLSICAVIGRIKGHYAGVNWDLVTAGAILHDIGKIYELSYDRSFGYTDEGRLLGHITIEMEMVADKIKTVPGFPADKALHLKHILLSHHGTLEFGSPKRPKTPEAILLSYLDDMDAKMNAVESLIRDDAGAEPDWTSFSRIFERYIYKGRVAGGASIGEEGGEEAGEEGGEDRAVAKEGSPKSTGGKGRTKDDGPADKELDLFSKG